MSLAMVALTATTLGAACSDEDALDVEGYAATTTVSIEPETFLGDLACSSTPGALRSHVVTLTDTTEDPRVFTLPSSPPASCVDGVGFRLTLPKHTYTAVVDGYDLPPEALTPFGGPGSGSRHMLRADNGQPVKPRWTTTCDPVTAASGKTEFVKECDPLAGDSTPGPTAIRVDPGAALGGLACAAQGGQVTSFDITPADPALPAALGLACGGASTSYDKGLTPGQTYTFHVAAHAEKDGPVVWGAQCSAIPQEGSTVSAVCDPLSSTGGISIPIGEILDAKGLACGKDIVTYEATLVESGITGGLVGCEKVVRFAPLTPGDYAISLHTFASNGAATLTFNCAASVIPGAVTPASCP